MLLTKKSNSVEQSPSWAASITLSQSVSFPPFTEPEGSLPCTQEPAIDPYLEPDESKQHVQAPGTV